jgi:hypothetical protein
MALDLNDAPEQGAASERRSSGNAFRADDALVQFRADALARGIELPSEIVTGTLSRCDTTGSCVSLLRTQLSPPK